MSTLVLGLGLGLDFCLRVYVCFLNWGLVCCWVNFCVFVFIFSWWLCFGYQY